MKKRLTIEVDFYLNPFLNESNDEMYERLEEDLARLKEFIQDYFQQDSGLVVEMKLENRDK